MYYDWPQAGIPLTTTITITTTTTTSRPPPAHTQFPTLRVLKTPPRGVRWSKHEPDHSPPPSNKTKNGWSFTSTLFIYFHSMVLRQRENFTSTFTPSSIIYTSLIAKCQKVKCRKHNLKAELSLLMMCMLAIQHMLGMFRQTNIIY